MSEIDVKDLISKRLKVLIENSKRTLEEIYSETGITPTSLSYYQNGLQVPGVDKILILEKYFKLESGQLLGEKRKNR